MQSNRRSSNAMSMQPPLPVAAAAAPPQQQLQRVKIQATEGKKHIVKYFLFFLQDNRKKKANQCVMYIKGHTVFSQNQLTALKYQIMAYKLLSKDTPLPLNLQQAVLAPFNGLSAESPTTPTVKPATTSTTTKKITKPQSPLRSIPHTKIPARPAYNAYVLPSQLLPKPISSYVHSSRQQRLLVPSLTPVGLDTSHIISQREERILVRVQNQIEEFNHNDIKQVIKVRALKLREKQQKVKLFNLLYKISFINFIYRSSFVMNLYLAFQSLQCYLLRWTEQLTDV